MNDIVVYLDKTIEILEIILNLLKKIRDLLNSVSLKKITDKVGLKLPGIGAAIGGIGFLIFKIVKKIKK